MINYLELFTENTRKYWNEKALCDWRGDGFTFGEVAAQITKLHMLFESTDKGGKMYGYTSNYIRVERPFDSSQIGRIVDVVLP